MAPPDLFLSYSRVDRPRAQLFVDAFAAAGLNLWWDTSLKAGEAYDEVTEKALRDAAVVVVLWSDTSVTSRWVRAEATQAQRLGRLMPCQITPCPLPVMFELTQTTDLSHWQGDTADPAWRGFLKDVLGRLGREMASPVPLPAAPAATPLLAVLPFDNLSSDSEMAFFSDGVSEEILGRLSRDTQLPVIGRTSSFQFRGPDKARAAAALNASHILDGTIRRSGNRIRVSAHLIDAGRQTTLWSDRFDRDLADIFVVQDEIADAIAKALDARLLALPTAPIEPQLYDLFLASREWVPDLDELRRRVARLETVTAAAPNFAPGWARLAWLRTYLMFRTPLADRRAARELAERESARAMALDPGLVDAALAQLTLLDPFGEILTEHAIVSRLATVGQNASDAQLFIANHLMRVGRLRAAEVVMERAVRLDPRSALITPAMGYLRWMAGDLNLARAALEPALAQWPNDPMCAGALAMTYALQQDWPGVDRLLTPERLCQFPQSAANGLLLVTTVMRSADSASRRLLPDLLGGIIDRTGHVDPTWAVPMGHFGQVDEAYALLERARFGPAGTAEDSSGALAYTPARLFEGAWPQLRNNVRFVKLCARLGLVEYWLATGHWPDCAETVPYDFRAECERMRDWPKDRYGD